MPGTAPERFWEALLAGRDLVTEVEPGRWAQAPYLHPTRSHPGSTYTFAAGSIGDVSGFDAGFFGISPREAALMDPQQRLLLEMSWEALENANLRPSSLRGSDCGVYIGISSADYSWRLSDDLAAIDASFATGNTSGIAANRLSYFYDLRGPSVALDTACSSSLVAFHHACRAIVTGEISQALTGAISLHLHPLGFISFSKASMLSRQGRCRVFDAAADGYVRSEGGGVFLLKELEAARRDGNPILAVVAHSAVNTDGRKSGLTVPSAQAQAALLEQAYRDAGIHPRDIDYVEAHGTGTPVGDPIETRALAEALARHRPPGEPLLIGSVKGNVGHLETASGVAGLVKALHCISHRLVPAQVGLQAPNPHIPLREWNLEVPTTKRPLRDAGRIVVGVNSFGFGGANAHVILESHDVSTPATLPTTGRLPIVVSAHDGTALKAAARALAETIARKSPSALYDIAYQSVFGREPHPHCAVMFGRASESITESLKAFAAQSAGGHAVECGTRLEDPSGAAFVYSGNGAQWPGMGRRLLADPTFKAAVREVDELFSRYTDHSLEAELAGEHATNPYERTEIAQPALFAWQVGVTAMLRQRGIQPTAVAGHSVGEVAAAWASGALSLAAAVSVIYQRSMLQGTTRGMGGMTAVAAGEPHARELLNSLDLADELPIACLNSSRGVTIAGPVAALERLEAALAERRVMFKRLDLDYAFHSAAMDGLKRELHHTLAHLDPHDAPCSFHSAVMGERLSGRFLDADYWWRNIREPVQFERVIRGMLAERINIFLEIGPHGTLRRYVLDALADASVTGRVITTGTRNDDGVARIDSAAGQAVIAGAWVDWQRILPSRGRHVRLPNYPWQRTRHWHPVTPQSQGQLGRASVHPLLGYALHQTEPAWENGLDTARIPYLADHAVGEAIVFPGAGYVELALAMAACAEPHAPVHEVEELEIRAPLLLAAAPSRVLRSTLDPRDGQLEVRSREQLAEDGWTLHAVGRVLAKPTDIRLHRPAAAVPARPAEFTGREHADAMRTIGLQYGPAFQAIRHGWIDADTAFAELTAPEPIRLELEQHLLHPALLDCTFQLILPLLRDRVRADHSVFVPTWVGHLSCRGGMSAPRYARARLLCQSPHSVAGEFELFDAALQPIAVLTDVRFQRLRSHHPADRVRYLQYAAVPRPLTAAEPTPEPLAFAGLRESLAACFDEAVRREHEQYAGEVEPLLGELCGRFIRESIAHTDRIADASRAYHASLLAQAQADAMPGEAAPPGCAQDIWNSLVSDYPDHFHIVHAVGRVGLHLSQIFGGEHSLGEVAAEQYSPASLLQAVLGRTLGLRLGTAIWDCIQAELAALPRGRRLKVVEMGGGAPVLGGMICRTLDFDRADYSFRGAGAALEEARRLRERHPAIEVEALSGDGGYDAQLAIVWLDFGSWQATQAALACARAQLAPGAMLLIVGPQPTAWLDFIQGPCAAWAGAAPEVRQPSPPDAPGFWAWQAAQHGFAPAAPLRHAEFPDSGAFLLTCTRLAGQKPQETVPGHRWLVLHEPSQATQRFARRLCTQLRALGALAEVAGIRQAQDVDAAVSAAAARGALHGVALLCPYGAEGEVLLHSQVAQGCLAAALVQACEAHQREAVCCIVTADAATDLLPGRFTGSIGGATLWGLTRTLMNETAGRRIRLIDLQMKPASRVALPALARELESDSAEQEVILCAGGARFVPRLRAAAPQAAAPVTGERLTRLEFAAPGQLGNLHWRSHARRAPGPGEVEVAVRATGVNFRDIMYTLGLLSDAAIEGGFAGPTLGLEFAGVVTQAGRGTAFAPGEAVVGFAPSSYSDHLIAPDTAVARIPEGLSFEAAATVPSAFFTAYYALHHLARLREGERVLIHGACGGVGLAAIQVARWRGAEVFATAGTEAKREFLKLLGVEQVFDSRSFAFADQILERSGGTGVDVVLNSLAGEAISRNLRVLKPFGRFLELGKRDFHENTRVGLRPFRNNLSYFGIDADQLMSAQPGLAAQLFTEVVELLREGVLRPLPYRAFDAADVVDAFRHMQQSRHIGKIVVTYGYGAPAAQPAQPEAAGQLQLSPEETWLVTGGLSGFGLRTAEWLAERGARNLVLVSRRGPREAETLAAVAQLEQRGVRVMARACDVTDRAALTQLLTVMAEELPPLTGIVHAAMVVADGLLAGMSAEQMERVLAPKVVGAQLLDELTRPLPLRYFVLYSSATTLFGSPGQGNYVAANCAIAALARRRRAQGMPATCVHWGAIGDVGYLARNRKLREALEHRMGGSPLSSEAALGALESLLLTDRSDLGVLDFRWSALRQSLPSAGTPKFSELAREGADGTAESDGSLDLRQLMEELSAEEFAKRTMELLKHEIAAVLRTSAEKIDEHAPLDQMGLDSLMRVELAVAFENRFRIRTPPLALGDRPTVSSMAAWLTAKLRSCEEDQDELRTEVQQIALQHAADASQAEIDRVAASLRTPEAAARRMIP